MSPLNAISYRGINTSDHPLVRSFSIVSRLPPFGRISSPSTDAGISVVEPHQRLAGLEYRTSLCGRTGINRVERGGRAGRGFVAAHWSQ